MELQTKERESRVRKIQISSKKFLSTMGHEGPVGIWVDHDPRLNT